MGCLESKVSNQSYTNINNSITLDEINAVYDWERDYVREDELKAIMHIWYLSDKNHRPYVVVKRIYESDPIGFRRIHKKGFVLFYRNHKEL